MRVFRYEDIGDQQAIEGDELHERFLARHARGPQLQLLKLRPELAANEAIMIAWLRQAERNAACQAPGFLPIVDFGTHGGAAFAAREHAADALPLATLLELLATQGESVSAMLAVHIARTLCEILNVAHGLIIDGHASPLVHGDLCAERVLVRSDGRLQLTELGFYACLAEERRKSGRVARAEHVAPERAMGLPEDARSDVFSLGILLRRMLVSSAGPSLTGATQKIVPTLPSHGMVVLMGRLFASVDERPRGVIDVLQELAKLPSHAAGTAVLAQLHEDARTRFGREPVRSPRESGISSKKTAMFVAPLIRGGEPRRDPPHSTTGESTGGFRARTQIFGSPQFRAAFASAAQPPAAPSAPAPDDHGRYGTVRLPQAGQPPMRASGVASTTAPGDDMPPLLSVQRAADSKSRGGTSRLDMTGMPPLLHQGTSSPDPTRADDSGIRNVEIERPPVLDGGAAARAFEPASSPIAQDRAGLSERPSDGHSPSDPRRPSGRAGAIDLGTSAAEQQSGLRRFATSDTVSSTTPLLPEMEVARTPPTDPTFAPEPRKREPWRDASETVFKLKTPAIMAKIAARERMSPALMFVVAMLAAAMLIVVIRFVVGLFV